MLAYTTSADQVDEYIRLAESTVLKMLHRFRLAIVDVFGELTSGHQLKKITTRF
jgi:hypothetical protein